MSEQKRPFVKERINRVSGSGKRFRGIIKTATYAVLFGIIASVTMAVIKNPVSAMFNNANKESISETVSINKDEYETYPSLSAENAENTAALDGDVSESIEYAENAENIDEAKGTAGTENGGNAEEKALSENSSGIIGASSSTETKTTETGRDMQTESENNDAFRKADIANEYKYTANDLKDMMKNLSELCDRIDYSVTSIYVSSTDTDSYYFYNDTVYSGIIVAETGSRFEILTRSDIVENVSEVKVKFYTGETVTGKVKKIDPVSDLAIIEVNRTEIGKDTFKKCHAAELGNSYLIQRGDLLIAVGSPKGAVYSADYAWVSYIKKDIGAPDGNIRAVYPGNDLYGNNGTWMINLSGQLVGFVTDQIQIDPGEKRNLIACISDYKAIIEDMINGKDSAYLGITVSEIDAEDISADMPKGLYITEVQTDGPAYIAGIQPGDILSEFRGEKIITVNAYRRNLEKLEPKEKVMIKVLRSGRDGYREIEYIVTAGSRQI